MKRMRKAGIADPVTGELVSFPYMPWGADLPAGWRRFATAEKVSIFSAWILPGPPRS
jgi:hypothetical protein